MKKNIPKLPRTIYQNKGKYYTQVHGKTSYSRQDQKAEDREEIERELSELEKRLDDEEPNGQRSC